MFEGTQAIELVTSGAVKEFKEHKAEGRAFSVGINYVLIQSKGKTCSCGVTVGPSDRSGCPHLVAAQLWMMAHAKNPECPAAVYVKEELEL